MTSKIYETTHSFRNTSDLLEDYLSSLPHGMQSSWIIDTLVYHLITREPMEKIDRLQKMYECGKCDDLEYMQRYSSLKKEIRKSKLRKRLEYIELEEASKRLEELENTPEMQDAYRRAEIQQNRYQLTLSPL